MLKANPLLFLCIVVLIQRADNCDTSLKIDITLYEKNKWLHPTSPIIKPGETKYLVVNCLMNGMKIPELNTLDNITLLRSQVNSSEYKRVASFNSTTKSVTIYDEGIHLGDGAISIKSQSYLSVRWKYPDYHMAGTYKCEANGTSLAGKLQTCLVSKNISTRHIKASENCLNIIYISLLHRPEEESLVVYCSVPVRKSTEDELVTSIAVLHSENQTNFRTKVMLFPESEIIPFQKLQSANGLISRTGDSMLNLHLSDLDYEEVAGRYMCRVEMTTKSGESRYCNAHKDISKVDFKNESCLTLKIDVLSHTSDAEESNSRFINIEPGSTEKLVINCSIKVFMTSVINNLKSLTLLRADASTLEYEEVASISTDDKKAIVKHKDAVGKGDIGRNGESYLYVEWPYPGYEMSGTYTCEAHGISKLEKPGNCSTSAVVSSNEISLKSVYKLQRLSLLENMRLQEAYKKYNEKANLIKDKANQLLDLTISETKMQPNKILSIIASHFKKNLNAAMGDVFSVRSGRFNGRRYYLSQTSSAVYNKKDHAACFKYGGYLAEINDDKELNFVRHFLKDYRIEKDLSILISGTDEQFEKIYYYERTANATVQQEGDAVTYLPWATGQPDGRDGQNCLYLSFNMSDWFFYDQKCARYRKPSSLAFLCEIDELSVPFISYEI